MTTPTRTYTIPAHIQARLTTLPIDSRPAGPDVEAWWAEQWRERGLPDPVTVSVDEFRKLVRERKHENI